MADELDKVKKVSDFVSDCPSQSKVANHLEAIREWIKESDRTYIRQDEKFILRFSKLYEFDFKATKKSIKRYYRLRDSYPDWFEMSPANESLFAEFSRNKVGYVAVPKNSDGPAVIVIRPGAVDLKIYSLEKLLIFGAMMVEVHMEDQNFNNLGTHTILDYKDIDMHYITKMTPRLLWRSNSLQSGMPIGIANIHVVNASSYLYSLCHLFRVFMSKSMTDMMVYHEGDHQSFQEYIRPEHLPVEYGGTAGPEQLFIDEGLERLKLFKNSNIKHGKLPKMDHKRKQVADKKTTFELDFD